MFWKIVLAVSVLALAATARAEPVAVVEDISVQRDDLQPMDFLDAGTKFELGAGETLVLGYLASCVQEVIVGGTITVNEEQSSVVGGQVTREMLVCEGGAKVSGGGKKRGAGAIVFRNKKKAKAAKAKHEVFGLSPLIRLTAAASEILVARMDGKGKSYRIAVENGVADLAKVGVELERKVSYRVKAGERSTTFRVSPVAERGAALLSRMLRF
ncbi:MAG: hypothetical protein QF797_06505 [Alphaproteobacteria bacterium]|jgi:hypothetical protein|nr:hypothetical protein [Rhodospirillaceae bacterium]MDP6404840.1 hypothetical protein [Alphaproteobacteria bacterium]MDP6622302.1 hypothetical protein [Alphaproteobacteria bacterium]|tara:strand:- start:2040 stop:2678 length:639 start_codon:yes stop_codon:yes gene_type:complete